MTDDSIRGGSEDEDDGGHGHDGGEHAEHDHPGDHTHGDEHGHHADDVETLGVAVVTVSSTRTLETDAAGDAIDDALTAAGHEVVGRYVVGDDYDAIQRRCEDAIDDAGVQCVITTGGTGVSPDDVTVEAAEALFDRRLPGFGELFRRLSYDEIGARVVATRATAGVADGVPVFCLPGSENAARLGAEEIVVDVAPHVAGLARGSRED